MEKTYVYTLEIKNEFEDWHEISDPIVERYELSDEEVIKRYLYRMYTASSYKKSITIEEMKEMFQFRNVKLKRVY